MLPNKIIILCTDLFTQYASANEVALFTSEARMIHDLGIAQVLMRVAIFKFRQPLRTGMFVMHTALNLTSV